MLDDAPAARRVAAWAPTLLLAAIGAAMAGWTWGTWPDVVVDFGRELYVPWRLTEGDVLHRDVAWLHGPLSPWWNALWFRLLGTSVRTLLGVNLALLAVATLLLHRLLAAASDRFAAFVACALFLLLFAFSQYLPNGSYNWVAPYSHEATHGVLLGLGALAALHAWRDPSRRGLLALAGALLGLAFLTRAHVFLAAAAGTGTLLALRLASDPAARARAAGHLGVFAAGALVPVALAFGRLAASLPAGEALRATLGSWPSVLSGGVADLSFYREMMGLARPLESLATLLDVSVLLGLLLLPALALAHAARGRRDAGRALAATTFAIALAGLWVARERLPWTEIARPLPLLVLLAAVLRARALAREGPERERARVGVAFAAFAFVLLGRMLLAARIDRYGFSLAAPGAMLAVAAGLAWVPAWLERRGAHGAVFAGALLALLVVATTGYLQTAAIFRARQTVVVGTGADAFRTDARGLVVSRSLEAVRERLRPGGTLAVVPEGVMLNYLARAPAPTRFVNLMPPELQVFGEATIRDALAAAPPDLVAVVHKDTAEYGVRFFGRDYARSIQAWLDPRYERVALFGKEPLTPGKGFGIALLAPTGRP